MEKLTECRLLSVRSFYSFLRCDSPQHMAEGGGVNKERNQHTHLL